MPVSIDEFESGDLSEAPSVPERVLTFLYGQRDKAFTRSEIATAIEADPNVVGTALSRLKDRNLVRHRDTYWTLTSDLERVRAAYELHGVMDRLDEDDGGIDTAAWDETAPEEPHPSEAGGDGDS